MVSSPNNEGIDGFCGGIWLSKTVFPDVSIGAIIFISKRFNLLVFYSISINVSLKTGVDSDYLSKFTISYFLRLESVVWLIGFWIYSAIIWL